ncbi:MULTISPECIES: restriction endonuclease subunit S [unclassified Empedobacter]|uniref:restriction endonuclease subunit S n=1 Tax=unclassified Empedobacter TaxID=2643773 RepID=UPI0025BCE23B|nr:MULTISPECIES: restriction endonuclease subunit S [unclassified Empedobacter]
MSKLDELLKGVDVEWRVFGDIASIKRGASPRPIAKFITDDENGVPWIKIGDTSPNSKYVENTLQKITAEGSKKSRLLKKGDFIISNSMSFGRPYILNIDGAIHDGWASVSDFSHTLSADYLYHYLSSSIVQNYWISKINSGSVSNLNADIIKSLQIPIPCPDNPEKSLEIQQEIVRVLDDLTSLTNQLTTELETERQNRKKQFEFFREQLFSFKEGNIEFKTLGDIGNVKMCKRIFKNETKDFGDIPFYKIGTFGKTANAYISRELYEDYKEKYSYPNKGDILISAAGTIGRTVVFDGKPAYFQDSNIIWIENNQEIIINEYLCHFYKVAKWFVSGGGTIDRLYNDNVRKTKIPIPFPNDKEKSIKEQERIVNLLDQLDATHTAIEEEITKEIKLRTQQYEYYREKLLSFPSLRTT